MKPISVGVLSKFTKLAQDIKIRLPSATVTNVASDKSGRIDKSSFKGLEIIVVDYDMIGPHLYSLDNIKFLQGTWAGIDALMPHVKPDEPLKYPIFRFSGKHFGKMISEYVLGCIVNHERDTFKVLENQSKKYWGLNGTISNYRTIYDLTIGVMGIGQIGGRVLSTLKFMGANTLAFGRRESINKKEYPDVDEYYPSSEISKFLTKCDYIVNTLPTTKETRGLLNHPILEACKDKQPIFINAGRGTIISDESLLKALENKFLSHAYLDVFNQEPLPENHPFWISDKINITPHVAAPSRPQDIAEQFVENLEMFQKNEVVPWQIDFARGY